jgi:hypothetical protein
MIPLRTKEVSGLEPAAGKLHVRPHNGPFSTKPAGLWVTDDPNKMVPQEWACAEVTPAAQERPEWCLPPTSSSVPI